MPRDLARRNISKIVSLAARNNRRQNLLRLRRRQNEFHMLRRLLQRLEQRIERLLRKHVHFIDDVDFEPAARRPILRMIQNHFARLVHLSVRRRVNLQNIHVIPARDRQARVALQTRRRRRLVVLLAVQRLGQNPRHRRLARPPRPREQIRMRNPIRLDRPLERLRNMILPHHLIECPRAIFSGKNGVRHRF